MNNAPEFTLTREGGRVIKTFVLPQPVHLNCGPCGWAAIKHTRVPAGEVQHQCPNGCDPKQMREAA